MKSLIRLRPTRKPPSTSTNAPSTKSPSEAQTCQSEINNCPKQSATEKTPAYSAALSCPDSTAPHIAERQSPSSLPPAQRAAPTRFAAIATAPQRPAQNIPD